MAAPKLTGPTYRAPRQRPAGKPSRKPPGGVPGQGPMMPSFGSMLGSLGGGGAKPPGGGGRGLSPGALGGMFGAFGGGARPPSVGGAKPPGGPGGMLSALGGGVGSMVPRAGGAPGAGAGLPVLGGQPAQPSLLGGGRPAPAGQLPGGGVAQGGTPPALPPASEGGVPGMGPSGPIGGTPPAQGQGGAAPAPPTGNEEWAPPQNESGANSNATGTLSTPPWFAQDPASWTDQMWDDFRAYIGQGNSNLGAVAGASLQGLVPGMGQAAALLNDPYNIPDARLNEMLEGTELAFNRAGNQARQFGLSSGAGHGGVSQMNQGNVQMARGAEQARNLREFEQFRTMLGDQRIGSLTDMFWDNYNQSEGVLRGTQTGGGGSDWGDYLQAFAAIYGAACWVARAVYGAENPRWLLVRHYILNITGNKLRDNYLRNGPRLAKHVKRDGWLREQLRPHLDLYAQAALHDLTA